MTTTLKPWEGGTLSKRKEFSHAFLRECEAKGIKEWLLNKECDEFKMPEGGKIKEVYFYIDPAIEAFQKHLEKLVNEEIASHASDSNNFWKYLITKTSNLKASDHTAFSAEQILQLAEITGETLTMTATHSPTAAAIKESVTNSIREKLKLLDPDHVDYIQSVSNLKKTIELDPHHGRALIEISKEYTKLNSQWQNDYK